MNTPVPSKPYGVSLLPVVQLLARVLLASVFVFSAIDKSLHFAEAVNEVTALGLPMPAVVTACVIVTQAAGSALLFFPRTAWVGAALLILFTVAATVLAHPFWREDGPDYTRQLTTFLEHLGIVGGLVLAGMGTRVPRIKPRTLRTTDW